MVVILRYGGKFGMSSWHMLSTSPYEIKQDPDTLKRLADIASIFSNQDPAQDRRRASQNRRSFIFARVLVIEKQVSSQVHHGV